MKLNKNIIAVGGILLFVILVFVVTSNNPNQTNSDQETASSNTVNLVKPAEFYELSKNPEAFMVDVHTPEQEHIPGTDAVISYTQIQQNIDQFPEDKDTPILVYCRSGSMSATASKELAELGYTNVYDLAGGINALKDQVNEVVINPSTQDLGEVIYGDVPTTSYQLTNFTEGPIAITRVSTSCGCTKASVEKETVEPYETIEVKVSFDPAVHGDDTDVGDITRTIFIETSHPDYKNLEAELTAFVVKK